MIRGTVGIFHYEFEHFGQRLLLTNWSSPWLGTFADDHRTGNNIVQPATTHAKCYKNKSQPQNDERQWVTHKVTKKSAAHTGFATVNSFNSQTGCPLTHCHPEQARQHSKIYDCGRDSQ